jgi:uncharacterized membrane protein
MGWVIWFAVVALVAGALLLYLFCDGVTDLVRDKRGEQ